MSKNKKLVPKRRFKAFQNADAWEQRELGDLAEIVRGASPRPIQNPKWFDQNSEIGWLRISDVTEQNGRIHFLEQRISEAGQGKTRVLHSSHLLLSIAATVGKPVINYVPTGVHDGFLIFLNPKFDLEFMFQWLEMFRPQWQKYGQPGSQVNLNSDLVKNQKIFIPSLGEQKEISSFFTNLDQTIAFQQRKLEKMKAMKSACLSEMFPAEGERKPKRRFPGFTDAWEQCELGSMTQYKNGKGHEDRQSDTGKYELINLNSISIDGGLKHSGKYIDEVDDTLLKNDLVMVLSDVGHGDLLGRVALIPEDNRFVLNQRVALLRPNETANSSFLFYYINAHQNYFKSQGAGTSQLNISKNSVETFKDYVPSKDEQIQIGQFFTNLDQTITFQQQKLEKLQNIKKAYLNEMFI